MNNISGSVWGKWDLHIHSKYSLESRAKLDVTTIFGEAIKNGLSTISITDHSSFDSLDEIWNVWETGEYNNEPIKDNIQFLPGIELRTDSGKHSVHVIAVFPHQIQIENTKVKADKQSLQDNLLSPIGYTEATIKAVGDGDKKTGLLKKTVNFYTLASLVHKLGGLIIIHAATKTGGLEKEIEHSETESELELLSSLGAEKEKIVNTADICELPNWGEKCLIEKEFYLNQFGKPSIVSSDSHEVYDGKRYTWIKADTTLEGLKQIKYEPGERVKIQSDNPYFDNKKVFFSNLIVEGSKNFVIPDIKIPLNRELVTLIGGRGSGKTALLESIAFMNEVHSKEDQNKKKKIMEYFRNNLGEKEPRPNMKLSLNLTDKDDNSQIYTKTLEETSVLGLPFLYIGQEQLSALATNDKELTQKICELINIDFSELDQNNLKDKTRETLNLVYNLESEVLDIYTKYSDYEDDDFEVWIDKYIEQKEEQKKKLSSKTTKNLLEEVSKLVDRGLKLRDYKLELQQTLTELDNLAINNKINELNKTEKLLYEGHPKVLPLVDLSTLKVAINKRVTELEGEVVKLRDDYAIKKGLLTKLGLKEDINVLLQAAEVIQREISEAAKDKTLYKEKMRLLVSVKKSRNQIFNSVKERLFFLKNDVDNKFVEFKKSRDGSKDSESELFSNVIKGINVKGTIVFDQSIFCKYVLDNCVDKRVIKNEEEVKALIAKRNLKGQANDISIENLKVWVEKELDIFIKSEALNTNGANNLINYLFMNWDKFISVRTIAMLNEIPTDRLSVGQRGTLLLKIYLATATAKQILIIDQPEDNLDNSFITHELVPLIMHVKKARQVIISTHNANLVVNADAEQVIVARLDKEGDYICGSIENPTINEYMKEILEGGEEAFRNRENKYGMKSLLANT